MSFLDSLIPTNLNEEKEKFLADPKYNPRFIYKKKVDQIILHQYKKTSDKYLDLANHILQKSFVNKSLEDLKLLEGPIISQSETEKTIYTFLHMHNLQKRFKIVWSSSFFTRTSITTDTVKLKIPANFRKEGLLGMLYHEIGTHALRRINNEKQPWFKNKKKFGFLDYLKTEEGLASIHALIPHTYKPAFNSALRYSAIVTAQKSSFVETWDYLSKYVQNPEKRWRMTFRQKRGLEDTSQPGGYSKDLVYFEGLVDVYQWLKKNDFDITNLYLGKIAYEDVSKAIKLSPNFNPMLPSFFSLSKEKYAQEIQKIGEMNELN